MFCPITNFDHLIDCGNFGIQSKCRVYSKLVVARTNAIAQVPFGQFSEIISIENNNHFKLNIDYV